MRLGYIGATFACAGVIAGNAHAAVDYYGGPVVTNVVVQQVSWGTGVNASVETALPAFYTTLVQSPYFDWLGEYDTVGKNGKADGQPGSNQRILPGSFGGMHPITPANTSATLTFGDITTELVAQIQANKLVAPAFDAAGNANTVYAIDFPSTIQINDTTVGNACQAWCTHYSYMQINGKNVPVIFLPATDSGPCAGGCGTGTAVQLATFWHSMELLNVATDPQLPESNGGRPAAWYGASGSIGDTCFGMNPDLATDSATLGSYTVAKGWSNRLGKCIVSDSNLPLCTGSNRPCRACATTDCSGGTPACENTPANSHQTECVACTKDADCKAPTPVCDRTTDTCVAAAPTDAGADATTTPDAGGAPDATTSDGGNQNVGGSGGCSCTTAGHSDEYGARALVVAGLAALTRRRRVSSRRTSS